MTTGQVEHEESLRAVILERPRNGRAMAKLACLLGEKAKLSPAGNSATDLYREAMDWAHRSVQAATDKPFGYMSLSILHDDHSKRMQALRKAILYHTSDDSSFIKLRLLIRLLMEPRQHESGKVSGLVGRSSPSHPSKRRLDMAEEKLYSLIARGLDGFWAKRDDESEYKQQEIALAEYRIGVFFRKRLPLNTSQSRAQLHLYRAAQCLPVDHEKRVVAEFWLSTLGCGIVNRCPPSYVVGLYSTFAGYFDDLLVGRLAYQTPTVLRKLLEECSLVDKFQRGLDLGCGTGLSGVAFRDKVHELLGVDLSPNMIAKATERACYDGLEVGDVTAWLASQQDASFDIVFACDVFVYLGDLKSVFASAHQVLSLGGIFTFSTELLEDSGDNYVPDFVLHQCARFCHSHSYVERLAHESSFHIVRMKICPIRKNKGQDVMGLLCVLQKREQLSE